MLILPYTINMTIEDIKEDHHVIDFLTTRRLRESTTKEYLLRINAYCNYLNKNPTEIIEEAEEQEDSNIRMKKGI
ncbi:hypothetical protein [Methanobacterium sp. ACI-7]|uniref:hypothetical protein n=1 Tax=unclassified Methanobacterium TaxID=2627676 RepID=UPI0039C4C035